MVAQRSFPGVVMAVGLMTAAAAQATPTVTARFDGFNPNAPVEVNRTLKNPYLTGPGFDTRRIDPGRFTLTRSGGSFTGTLVGTAPPQFFAFCIEPLEFINQGNTYTFDLVALENGVTNIGGMGIVKADYIRELFHQQMPDLSAVISNEKASALNVAIWEIVRENPLNSLNVFSGDASYTSFNAAGANMLTLAQSYLTPLTGTGPKLDNLFALNLDGTQDLLVQVRAVPEPSTWMSLASAGFVGLLAFGRRARAGRARPEQAA
jgi:hypothetical protein